MTTVTEDDEEEVVEVDNTTMADSTIATSKDEVMSENTNVPKPAPFQTVSVNDGTHRVKFKWTVSDAMQGMENDPVRLNDAIKDLMTAMFQDDDGMMYRWQSDDLTTSSIPSAMTSSEIRDHISPAITHIKAKSMIIFGIRFGFTDNPIKWQMAATTKQMMKENQVEVSISNSTSTSGNIVTAGYILLKSPNSTSTHRYTQHLRSQLPDATPYFDVMKFRKTPYDQSIPHLAVQCGEKHVTPVSQALSKILSGKSGAAVFLPRYVFSELTDQQIEHQFESHYKWSRSLKLIALTPLVFHLDQKRIEYDVDGTTIERSTREWVATLTNSDGTPALCDVVNGTPNKKAFLLAPAHYEETAKAELKKYRLRLHPPRQKEERFRDRVHDLPAVIHIQTAIESNVQYIANLFASDMWTSVTADEPSKQIGRAPSKSIHHQDERRAPASRPKASSQVWNKPPNIPRPNGKPSSQKTSELTKPSDATTLTAHYDLHEDDGERSTESTQGTNVTYDQMLQAKLKAIEITTKEKLSVLESTSKTSLDKLLQLEKQVERFSDLDGKVESVERELSSMSVKLDDSVTTQLTLVENLKKMKKASKTQFNSVSDHLVSSGETVNHLTDAMAEMRSEMGRMSTIIQGIATRQLDQETRAATKRPSPKSVQEFQTELFEKSQSVSDPFDERTGVRQPSCGQPSNRTLRDATQASLPDSSSDNSVASSTSKTSYSSANTVVSAESTESQASSIIRSPPPKKTRQGCIPMSPASIETSNDDSNPEIPDDQDVFNDDTAMFDAVLEDAIRTNLASRFEASVSRMNDNGFHLPEQREPTPDTQSQQHHAALANTMDSVSLIGPTSQPAPLNPRNKNTTGSAGAATE